MHPTKFNEELLNAIQSVTPTFASSLKRRFTNVAVRAEALSSSTSVKKEAITLEDQFFKSNDNQVTLTDIVIKKYPTARLNEIHPNLLEKYLRFSSNWYDVILVGSYRMTNANQLNLLPVEHSGKLEIKIENITAAGAVGFRANGYAFKTTNFHINFKPGKITVQVEYMDNDSKSIMKSIQTEKPIDETIMKYMKMDLYWKLQESLRDRLDKVLLDFTVQEIFSDDDEIVDKYMKQPNLLNFSHNYFIDKNLTEIKNLIILRKLTQPKVPDLIVNFSHIFGFLNVWGKFISDKGFVYDLSHIRRQGEFSIMRIAKSNDFQLWGSFDIENLHLNFDHFRAEIWNMGALGDIKAVVKNNSFKYVITAEIKDSTQLDGIIFKNIDLQVEQFENIEVKVTGLGVLLNWLLSFISTWITGYFKQEIASLLEKELKSLIKTFYRVNEQS